MALTLNLTFGSACSGGGHFSATGTLSSGQSRTLALTKGELHVAPTSDEIEAFLSVLLKLYVRQLAGTTAAQIKTALEAKTLNLTVAG